MCYAIWDGAPRFLTIVRSDLEIWNWAALAVLVSNLSCWILSCSSKSGFAFSIVLLIVRKLCYKAFIIYLY